MKLTSHSIFIQWKSSLVLLFFFIISSTFAKESYRFYIPKDVYDDYKKFSSLYSVNNDYQNKYSRRDVVEVVIFNKIFTEVCNCNIEYVTEMNYKRALLEVHRGSLDGIVTSVWKSDLKKMNLISTIPIVKAKEFEVAFYTVNKENIKNININNIKNYQIVTNPHWAIDYQTLQDSKFKKILKTLSWTSIVKMLEVNRADITMAPLSGDKDHIITVEKVKLYPIPNIKIHLNDDRVFVFSKKHKGMLDKINSKIQELTASGERSRAYEKAGFFNRKLSTWKSVN